MLQHVRHTDDDLLWDLETEEESFTVRFSPVKGTVHHYTHRYIQEREKVVDPELSLGSILCTEELIQHETYREIFVKMRRVVKDLERNIIKYSQVLFT